MKYFVRRAHNSWVRPAEHIHSGKTLCPGDEVYQKGFKS